MSTHSHRFNRKNYYLQEGLLMRVISPSHQIRPNHNVIVAPAVLTKQIIAQAHDGQISGHRGGPATVARILETFWWTNMDKQVDKYIGSCHVCLSSSPRNCQPDAPLQSLPEPHKPNDRIHTDLFGPLDSSTPEQDGRTTKKYICVITDAFTKIVRLMVIPNRSIAERSTARRPAVRRTLTDGSPSAAGGGGRIGFRAVQLCAERLGGAPARPDSAAARPIWRAGCCRRDQLLEVVSRRVLHRRRGPASGRPA